MALNGCSWDKDLLGKEYLGEVSLPVEDWFKNRIIAFEDPDNTVSSLSDINRDCLFGRRLMLFLILLFIAS